MPFYDESSIGGGFSINFWSWDMNNDGIYGDATSSNPVYSVSPAGWDTVGLIVRSNSSPACSSKVKEAVFVNPIPVVDFTGVSLKGCPNVNTAFTNLSTVSSGSIQSVVWNFGNGQISNSLFPLPQIYTNASAIQPQYYSVSLTVTTDSGCTATKQKANYIEVYPKPKADLNWGLPEPI